MQKLLVIILLILSSCNTLKSKRSLVNKRIQFFTNYSRDKNNLSFSTSGELNITENHLKDLKKKEIKRLLKRMEKGIATFPDSVSTGTSGIDSFYTNAFKIKFIKDNRLKTGNIYFIE